MAGKLKGAQRYFYLKDHLGSTRAIVNGNGTVLAGYDYDAWGYLLENRSLNSDSIKFKYTGKERDKESSYDYFGARYYDARIGRWGQVEPLFDKYPSLTPYNYSVDNPLRVIDPNGLDPFEIIVRTYIPTEYAFNFRGDNRGTEPYATSYRTEHIITVETNPNVSTNPLISDDKGKTGLTIGYFVDIEGNPTTSTGKAEGDFFVDVIRGEENLGDNAILTISGSSTNPLIPLGLAPPIQYNFSIQIIPGAKGTIVKILGGGRTEYPSLEIYVESKGGERQLIENYPATEGFFAPFDLNYKTYMNPLQENIK